MSWHSPQLTFLDTQACGSIHKHAKRLLQETGIEVQSANGRDLFMASGACTLQDQRICIGAELIEWALERTPSHLDVFNRERAYQFSLGNAGDPTRFGVGVTNIAFQRVADDSISDLERRHIGEISMLAGALDSFDLLATPGFPKDVEGSQADLITTLEMTSNTVLPLSLLISEPESFRKVLEMLESLHGPLGKYPFLLPYVNPITPLILNEATIEKCRIAIQFGLPIIYSNYSMYGATTPMSAEGSLILLHAELLAGITLCQLLRAGTPLIVGSLPASFDMYSMSSVYTEQSYLINLACAELMADCGIPHCGSSGSGKGWGTDLITSGEFWLNHLSGILGKVGLAPFVGGNFDSMALSPGSIIYSDLVITSARSFSKGLEFGEFESALAEIEAIGPGGTFLTSAGTLEAVKDLPASQKPWPSHTLDSWQAADAPQASDLLKNYSIELMQDLKPPADHGELLEKGERIIANLK